jgi:hypothetical protein
VSIQCLTVQVGQYVGHTAPKTKDMIKKAFGGILLVDEAYYLYNASNDKDYGQVITVKLLLLLHTFQCVKAAL